MIKSQYGIPSGESVSDPPALAKASQRSPSLAEEMRPAHSLSITKDPYPSQRKEGLGEQWGGVSVKPY